MYALVVTQVEVLGQAPGIVCHDVVAVFPHPVCQRAGTLPDVSRLTPGADDQVDDVGCFACKQGLWV